MEYVMLKDVCAINMGQSPDSNSYNDEGNGVPFFQGNADFGERYPVTRKWCSTPTKMAMPGDILISVRAPIGALNYAKEECCIGRGLAALTPDKSKVSSEFIFWLLKSKNDEFNDKGTGSTFKAIGRSVLEETIVPNISLKKQVKCAETLEKIYAVIQFRKLQLQKLDELIKARFVEMFGNTVNNDRNWETARIEDICKDIIGGGTPAKSHPEYYENAEIPWISSKDMKTDILYDSQIKINGLGVDNSTAKVIPTNSVIMVIRSGILKHTLPVAVNAVPVTINQDLKAFVPNEKIIARFMAIQLKMHEKDILAGVRAVTADNIEFNSLKQRVLVIPPIGLQSEFVAFTKGVNKSKVAVQKALEETQLLFDSLMQQYFG